ncbi:Macrophage colony-stimulating factor 1 receptor [Blastocladiella emersonii ATCC 22665]|nr:Macrophage colony-stimulating factor 1 receptor [Blastocladiella emersonii ATCC 22665]
MAVTPSVIVDPTQDLSSELQIWTFFVYCLVVVVVMLFFLFYFNRLVASVLSWFASYWTWRNYRAHVEVESVKLAILGGRLSFRNLRYHAENQSICILQGHITFRYWSLVVREERDVVAASGTAAPAPPASGSASSADQKVCRIGVRLKGVEWIMYNRTPVFDWIEEQLRKSTADRPLSRASSQSIHLSSQDPLNLGDGKTAPTAARPPPPADSWFRQLFPIEIVSGKGCIVVGNPQLPTVLVLDWKKANGSYAIVPSRSPLDQYKSVVQLAFSRGHMQMRANVDYRPPSLTAQGVTFQSESHLNRLSSRPAYRSLRAKLRSFFLGRWTRPPPAQTEWHGLHRYQPAAGKAEAVAADEYAQVTNVVDFSELLLSYYTDTAGICDPTAPRSGGGGSAADDIGNGDLDPEWGVDLVFQGATVHYGPWTDRQRARLQNFFFPFIYRDTEVTHRLSPGDLRLHTALKVFVKFKGPTTWRVPTREASKDATYASTHGGDAAAAAAAAGVTGSGRPYGWLDIKVEGGASAMVIVPMIARPGVGYTTTAHVTLHAPSVSSSVNYAEMLRCERIEITAAMPSPETWNAERTWTIGANVVSTTAFLLRDHINLVQDLIGDWASDDPLAPKTVPPLAAFTPFRYRFDLAFRDLVLYLCINELNVIDVPNDLEQNNFLVVRTDKLTAGIDIPLVEFMAPTVPVGFNVELMDATADFSFSASTTFGAFLSPDARRALQTRSVGIRGSYTYNSTAPASDASPDVLEMDITAGPGTIHAFGFLVRYLIILIDNYIGLTPDYMTLEEYKSRGRAPASTAVPGAPPSAPQDTMITAVLTDIKLVLPETLYALDAHSALFTHQVTVDTRITPHFQDIQVDLWPVSWTGARACPADNLALHAIAIHGHRLFGLPPDNPEYAVSWRVDVDRVAGSISLESLHGLAAFAKCFDALIDDFDNRIAPPEAKLTSLAQIAADVQDLDVRVVCDEGNVLHLAAHALRAGVEDLGADSTLLCTLDALAIVHSLSTAASGGDDALEIASVRSRMLSAHLRSRPGDSAKARQHRLAHVRKHDAPTGRVSHLFGTPLPESPPAWFAPPMFSSLMASQPSAPGMPFSASDYNLYDLNEHAGAPPASSAAAPRQQQDVTDAYDEEDGEESSYDGDAVSAIVYDDEEDDQVDPMMPSPASARPGAPLGSTSPHSRLSRLSTGDGVGHAHSVSQPDSASSTSVYSFATAPDFDSVRQRSSTQTSSQHRFGSAGGGAAAAAAGHVRFPVSGGDAVVVPYRHFLRIYDADAVLMADTLTEQSEDEAAAAAAAKSGVHAPHALLALLESYLADNDRVLFVECHGSMDVVVTPASLARSTAFAATFPTVDSMYDSLYLSYIAAMNRAAAPAPAPSSVTIGIALSAVTLVVVQDLPTQDLLKTRAHLRSVEGALGPDWIQLQISGLDFAADLHPGNPLASASPPSSGSPGSTGTARAGAASVATADPVMTFHIDRIVFDGSERIRGDCSTIDLKVAKPELLPLALEAWTVPDLDSPPAAESFLALMAAAAPPAMRDPAFLAQPSNLWRLGARTHQQAQTWRLLCHFRAYMRGPAAHAALAAELRAGRPAGFAAAQVPALLRAWKMDPVKMADAFRFVWAAEGAGASTSFLDVAAGKLQKLVTLNCSNVLLAVEDNTLAVHGIHLSSRAGEQIVLHTDSLAVALKPSALALAKTFIEQATATSPTTATPAAPAAASAKQPSARSRFPFTDRHVVVSFGTITLAFASAKISASLVLSEITASWVTCMALQLSGHAGGGGPHSTSTGPNQRERHESWSWMLASARLAVSTTTPLAVLNLRQCTGISRIGHVARIGELEVDLPQNIIQFYAFVDEWKNYVSLSALGIGGGNGAAASAPGPGLLGEIQILAPSVAISLGALPSLSVHSKTSVAVSLGPAGWMVDVSRNQLGFQYVGQPASFFVTLPTLQIDTHGGAMHVLVGRVEGTVSSSTLEPIETSLSLLGREIDDVLELLLYLSPEFSKLAGGKPAAVTGPAAAAAGSDMRVSVACDGVSLLMVTERGNLHVHSGRITGSKASEIWTFHSDQFSLAFLSTANAVLSHLRFGLSVSSAAAMRVVVHRLDMMVQPKAMLQLVDLVAYITAEAKARRKAKQAELGKLTATTQKVIDSLDLRSTAASPTPDAASAAVAAETEAEAAPAVVKDFDLILEGVTCHLLVDARHSTEFVLREAAFARNQNGTQYVAVVHDMKLSIDGSTIAFPEVVLVNRGSRWECTVRPTQLTIQSHLLPSIFRIIDESTNVILAAQVLADSLIAPPSPVAAEPVAAAAQPAAAPADSLLGLTVDFTLQGGKGTLIDSVIALPWIMVQLRDGLMWVHVAETRNTLLPSVINLVRSLLESPRPPRAPAPTSPSSPRSTFQSAPSSPVLAAAAALPSPRPATAAAAPFPFRVLVVIEPTIIDLKGKVSKCVGQVQFAATAFFDPARTEAALHVSNCAVAIHHPFATDDCLTASAVDLTVAYNPRSGMVCELPELAVNVVLRHFADMAVWVDEWTEFAPRGSCANTGSSAVSREGAGGWVPSSPTTTAGGAAKPARLDLPHTLVKIGAVRATVQMGQAIGVATVTIPDVFVHAERNTIHVSTSASVVVTGRVQARFDAVAIHATAQVQPSRTVVEAGLDRIAGTLQYQTAVVLVLNVSTIGALLVARAVAGSSVGLDVRVGDVTLLTSARTVPAFLNIQHRVRDVLGLSLGVLPDVPAADTSGSLPRPPHLVVHQPPPSTTNSEFSGHITFLLGYASVHVYGESLLDADHMVASLDRTLVHLTVNAGNPTPRVLKAHLDKLKLTKVTLAAAEGNAAAGWTPDSVQAWVARARGTVATPGTGAVTAPPSGAAAPGVATSTTASSARTTKLIAQVPKSDLTMSTWTTSADWTVRHVFVTQFDGLIDLALNMILYRNLQDVLALYESEIARTRKTLQVIATGDDGDTASPWTFVPVEPAVLAPRLKMMGEATPPLEWLLKKDVVPELAHRNVTVPLDEVLRALAGVFGSDG